MIIACQFLINQIKLKIMNGSIISLIQENRKLFYRGILKNSYKTSEESSLFNNQSIEHQMPSQKNSSFKTKSIQILQEIFSE